MIFKKAFLFYSISLLLTTISAQAKETLAFLAYGNLYHQIEPCGCDPLTDLGGIRRLGTLLDKIYKKNPQTLILDLGNNFKSALIKENDTFYLKKALDLIKTDASLLNSIELSNLQQTLGERNYVLSNAKTEFLKKHRNILSTINAKKSLIFGFLEEKNPLLNLNLKELNLEWKEKIKKEKPKFSVLLFSGTNKVLKKLEAFKIFDLIISSNTKNEENKTIYEEQKKDHLLLRQFDSFHVKMVPMLGRGVLTHQVQLLEKNSFTQSKFSTKTPFASSFKTKPKLAFIPEVPVYWLEKKYDIGSPLSSFLKKYKEYKTNIFHKLAQIRKKELTTSHFIGAEACKSCHQKAYNTWKKSKHAHAFLTLENKDKAQDTSCIGCHVLGWKQKGGFASAVDSPSFKNVQCENCHGPSKAHSQDPRIKPKEMPFNNCLSCHNITHSPHFDQKKYWKKISH